MGEDLLLLSDEEIRRVRGVNAGVKVHHWPA
jgi:hypothetical protein